jgi:hypothetical protein
MATKPKTDAAAIARLRQLADSLQRHNFRWPARAIADYLAKYEAGKPASLDESFGLAVRKQRAGSASSSYRHARKAIPALLDGKSWREIADDLAMDAGQLRREVRKHLKEVVQELYGDS